MIAIILPSCHNIISISQSQLFVYLVILRERLCSDLLRCLCRTTIESKNRVSYFPSLFHFLSIYSQLREITSSATEIEEIFHNPAGGLHRGPPDDPSGRKIYLKLRSIQSEGCFLALDSAPRKREKERTSGPSRKLLNARERVRRVSCTYVDTTHTVSTGHEHTFAVASILTHPHLPRLCVTSVTHTGGRRVSRRGTLVKLKRGYPAVLPSFPVLRGTTGGRPMESRVRGGAFGVGQHGSSSSCSPAGGHSAEEDPLRTSLVDTPVSTYCSSHVSLSRSLEPHVSSRQQPAARNFTMQ